MIAVVDDSLDTLRTSILAGYYAVFVGSGPSAPLYPTWKDLVVQLCTACDVGVPSDEERARPEVLLEMADNCRLSNEVAYRDVLARSFGGAITTIPRIYLLLAHLPFRAYLTTNFDPLLESALKHTRKETSGVCYIYPSLSPPLENGNLYQLHGLIAQGATVAIDDLVLTHGDFVRAYSIENSTLRPFLELTFIYTPCVFVGGSLGEPQLEHVLQVCRRTKEKLSGRSGGEVPRHYALLPIRRRAGGEEEERGAKQEEAVRLEQEETRRFEEMGVRVCRYDPIDEKHSGLVKLLDDWVELKPLERRSGFEVKALP